MPLDFPNSPTIGQTFSSSNRTWTWTGTVWNLVTGVSTHAATHAAAGSDPITISQSQVTGLTTSLAAKADVGSGTAFPGSPTVGQIFVNTTTRCAFVWTGAAWDEISRPNPVEPFLTMGV